MNVDLDKAEKILRNGGIVAIPTETVYGLAADAFNSEAVEKTFSQKGRPSDNPLIVHISDVSQLHSLAETPPSVLGKLAEKFWPGPLTLVLRKLSSVPDIVTGGLATVAVRMPDHPLTLKLISRCGPLTAPSANKSGRPSPTKASHVEDDFGKEFPVLNGGDCDIGLESTVLDLTSDPFTILRPGAIARRALMECIGEKINSIPDSTSIQKPVSPGIKYTHYKPDAAVFWIKKKPEHIQTDIFYILHSPNSDKFAGNKNVVCFAGNYRELAKQLYDLFRTADHLGFSKIAVEMLPDPTEDDFITPLHNRISKATQIEKLP
jgi:L-threonylcarbamoyladenylate synthase